MFCSIPEGVASRFLWNVGFHTPEYVGYITPVPRTLIPCSKVLLEKLLVPQLVTKFSECSLPCTQRPATCRQSEPYQFITRLSFHFFKMCFNIMFPSTPRYSKQPLSFRCLKLYIQFCSPNTRSACSTHPIVPHLFTWTIYDRAYQLRRSPWCNFL